MGVYSNTTANAYADQIKVVYEYLDEIRKVGGRLTPVEDLASFQAQIAELHGYLDLLVEASNIIVTATPTGEAILTGSVPSIRTLLGIDNLTGNWVQPEDLQAALDALRDLLLSEVETNTSAIAGIDVQLVSLEQYAVYQQSEINGLQISYSNVAAGLETNQTNTEQALSRLTVREQHATLQDLRLDTIDQSLVSTVLGIQATNDIVAGHTASISTIGNTVNLHTTSIDSLNSTLTLLDADVTANATAIDLMETNITAVGDDITAESNRITALRAVIGGSGNLLPNADFASNANGWGITVAEEDWATTVLTVDLFNMPVEVHCLEVLGTPTPLGQIVVESSPVLIQGGKHHIVSGYPCVDNGTIVLSYKTFNAVGAVLDQGVCPPTFNTTTSTNINDYTRTFVKFLAAETAVKMRLYMTVTGDGDFVTQGALFRPMVEQSWEGQVEPSAWTPNLEGVPQALAEATEELTTRVTSIEGVNTAQATQITTLEARATTIEGVNTSQATAISGLDTRVTAAEGINTSQASSITSLTSRITAAEGINTSQATALTTLDSRVTATEGSITSQSTAITNLTATVNTITAQGLSIAAGQTDAANDWIAAAGAGERSTIASSDTSIMGGRLLQIGNNSDNDELWLRHKDTIPYDPNKLYRVRIRGRLSAAGTNRWYAGLFAMNRDKTLYVAGTGTESGGLGGSHYVVASANNDSFIETVAYFKGFSVGARTGSGTLADPWTMPNNVKHIGFMVIGNYTAQTGITYIDKLVIEDADALEANAATASAVTLLDARVDSVEGVNTSQATSITTLNSAVAGKADVSAVTALTTRVTDVEQGGYGVNLIPNSSLAANANGYTFTQSATPAWTTPTLNLGGASWHPARINALGTNNTSGGLAAGDHINIRTMAAEIGRAGEAFIASVYVAAHRCQVAVIIEWLNAAGAVINYSVGTAYNAGAGSNGGTDLTDWARLVATGTAPAGTQSAKVLVQFQGNGNGTPYGWIIRPMLERKRATQTLPSEWNAGGVEMFASWSVTLDVNGYVTGVTLASDGTTSAMNIRADMFSIVSPGGGARTEYSNGNWRVYDASNVMRVRMGIW